MNVVVIESMTDFQSAWISFLEWFLNHWRLASLPQSLLEKAPEDDFQWLQENLYRKVILPFLGYFLAKELHEWLNTRRKWKFKHKNIRRKRVGNKISHFSTLSSNFACWFEVCENFAQWTEDFAPWTVVCEIVPQLDAVVFRRPYLSHFSSKSYMV